MLTDDQFKNKWTEFKGGLMNVWGMLTDEDLEKTQGNLTRISGLIHNKYGESQEAIQKKLNRLLDSFDNETDKNSGERGSTSYMREPNIDQSH